jgi:hypothetical protein
MLKSFFIFVGLVFLCAAGAAHADWQGTRWGMSLEELRSIKQNIELTTAEERKGGAIAIVGEPLAKGSYATSHHSFKVYFHFRDSGLAGVRLEANEPQHAGVIFNDLKLTYGPPTGAVEREQIGRGCLGYRGSWRDERNRNVILFAGVACPNDKRFTVARIIYQPILKPGEGF